MKQPAHFKPFLACDIDLKKARFPLMSMPKIDGVRGLNIHGSLVGRTLRPLDNLFANDRFGRPEYMGFDGELTLGNELTRNDLCRITSSALSTIQGNPEVYWNVFDLCALTVANKSYIERYAMMRDFVATQQEQGNFKYINVVPYVMVHNEIEFLEQDLIWCDMGYEGSIGRDPSAKYKHGRSTAIQCGYVRYKTFVQEDALVLSINEGQTNENELVQDRLGYAKRSSHMDNMVPNGMVGSLQCRDVKTGDIITVGAGKMTADERRDYFQNPYKIVNQIISYKHFPKGVKDKPRFPTFVNIRNPSDVVKD